MAYPTPPKSKSDVRRAGQAISEGKGTDKDHSLVESWRASHGYVINTFQAMLRKRLAKLGIEADFAQRLKRRNTVIDKLQRADAKGKRLILDVTSMHDFAGCRIIFRNLNDLQYFRSFMHSTSGLKDVDHKLRHQDTEKFNYIARPKPSGYRGIHDVYRHFPRGSARREVRKPWDGLLVEIQYRTQPQHAWATAVEISDLLDGENTKFELDQSRRGRFFALASEIIARRVEGIDNAFEDTNTNHLLEELHDLENNLGILRRLRLLKQFEEEDLLQRHNVLNIYRVDDGSFELEILPFSRAQPAIEKASELEKSENSVNAVYVHADNPKHLRSAYRNYFYDPVDFVQIITSA
ncbi:MAG: RelA/SpoT domain-containing protein [Pseudomonadota bacterium]|nr:RelA/SpoT domain-containing protein [Pseudomonadota bacterium]